MKEKTYYINISTNYKIDFDDIDKNKQIPNSFENINSIDVIYM